MKKILFFAILLFSNIGHSQFCNTATTTDNLTPTSTVQYTVIYSSGRRAFTFDAVAGNEYTFSTVGQTSIDTYLRLYDSSSGGTLLSFNDDYNNTQSEITWYCSSTGTYSIFLTRWTSSSTCAALNANCRLKYQMGSTAGSTIVSIGNGDGVVYVAPSYHYYKYGWTQNLYLQSEINTVGNITKIRFQVDADSPASYTAENQKIYMAHTTYSTLPSVGVKEDAQTNYASSNYLLVFSGTVVWSPGWVEITLDTPFPWNNTNNLLIKWENREGTYSASYPGFYYTSKTSTVGYQYADASYPTSDGTRDGFRPNIKLAISEAAAPLPVEMHSFTGEKHPYFNEIKWTTNSEYFTSHFVLQKSDSTQNWETIEHITAEGNSTTLVDYAVMDSRIENTINYYRLLQYDINGHYQTYGPISIDNTKKEIYIIRYINMAGQEVSSEIKGPVIVIYSDGTSKRIIK